MPVLGFAAAASALDLWSDKGSLGVGLSWIVWFRVCLCRCLSSVLSRWRPRCSQSHCLAISQMGKFDGILDSRHDSRATSTAIRRALVEPSEESQ